MKKDDMTPLQRVAIQELDGYRRTKELAEEEYGQALDEYEEQYGEQARETYEEKYV